jgi:hypothetical protein
MTQRRERSMDLADAPGEMGTCSWVSKRSMPRMNGTARSTISILTDSDDFGGGSRECTARDWDDAEKAKVDGSCRCSRRNGCLFLGIETIDATHEWHCPRGANDTLAGVTCWRITFDETNGGFATLPRQLGSVGGSELIAGISKRAPG